MGHRADTVHRIEPFWDAQVAIAAVIGLDSTLPPEIVLTSDYRWTVPLVTGVLLVVLMYLTPWNSKEAPPRSPRLRMFALAVIGIVVAIHMASLVSLLVEILDHRNLAGGKLLWGAAELWVATWLIFAVFYWELDRDGPIQRSQDGPVPRPPGPDWHGPWPDFLFPQMADDAPSPPSWMPGFVDYLYLAATNSTAFSPTDVMPLSRPAKLLMLTQSTTSFVLVALVTARAVNVLT
jgi:uncharacterized membrane protein